MSMVDLMGFIDKQKTSNAETQEGAEDAEGLLLALKFFLQQAGDLVGALGYWDSGGV